jgi:hypothetical protein
MRKIGLFIAVLFCLNICVIAQTATLDLSSTDITKLKNFNGVNASFMGLKVGLSKADGIKILNSLSQFYWEFDLYNTVTQDTADKEEMRIYVYTKKEDGEKGRSILYLIWDKNSLSMTSIVFYEDIADYLKGKTKELFTKAALDKKSSCRNFLKTTPTEVTSSRDITTITFAKEHTAIIKMVDDSETSVWFKFFK